MLKGSQTKLSNGKSVKVTKNVIDFKFQKWNLTNLANWQLEKSNERAGNRKWTDFFIVKISTCEF